MTPLGDRPGWRRFPLVERVGYHLARARAWARRATAAGLAVRATIWLTGAAGLLLALPGSVRGPALPLAVLVALLPAVAPASGWVAVLELAAIGAVALSVLGGSRPVPVLLAVAALLYAHHTGAALGAQLRTDTVVPPAVFRHWAARAGLVLAASTLLGLGIVVLAGQPGTGADTGYLALGAAATAVAAIVVGALVYRGGGQSSPGDPAGED